MLSVSNVSAGAAASGYYQTEGYYVAGTPEAQAAAQWFGKAAAWLASQGQTHFQGQVDDATFSTLLEGHAPPTERDAEGNWRRGQILGRWVDGEREHRPGMDLTFSTSKSVSVMALVARDDRVVEAHDSAARAAMSWIEANVVATRRAGPDGAMEVITGGQIIAGLFRHDTSRALDPQLHTHAVITNMVLGPDGKWTALHNDELYHSKMLAGEIYRNELARNLRGLGFAVDRSGKDGIVEIAGVPQEMTALYSKRSEAIGASLDQRGLEATPENRALAALATRVTKSGNLDREALHAHWTAEALAAGLEPGRLPDLTRQAGRTARLALGGVTRADQGETREAQEAKSALAHAVAHLSERQSVYPMRDLLRVALPRLDAADIQDLSREVTAQMKEKSLLYAGMTGLSPLLTDRETLAVEREMLRSYRSATRAGKLDLSGLILEGRDAEKSLARRLQNTSLTEGQRDAVMTGLTGTSRIVGVQGYAGTGKTFMVETLRRYAEQAGYDLSGLAPSGRAVEALKEAIPTATTLQSWLTQIRQGGDPGREGAARRILLIDEAGMLSSHDMRDLLAHANRSGFARVILVGDVKQLDAVAAGQPFAQLQRAGMPTALMTDIQRQKTEDGREAVLHAIKGEVKAAMVKIDSVEETKGKTSLPETIAKRWLELDTAKRAETGIAVLTNTARGAVTEVLRDALRAEGQLAGPDQTLLTMKPAGLTRAAAGDARSYTVGDIILPLAGSKQHGIEKDAIYVVLSTDVKANRITVQDVKHDHDLVLPLRQDEKLAANFRVYTPQERAFAEGDRIRFTIQDKSQGIINGSRGRVLAVDADRVTVRLGPKEVITLPTDSIAARGMDHAYASTAHDFQGSTVGRILIGMSSTEQLATQKSFYVNISRMRDEAMLITDDAAALAKRIQANTGVRPAALDAWLKAERERMGKEALEAQERGRAAGTAPERDPDRAAVRPPEERGNKAPDQKDGERGIDRDLLFSLKVEATQSEVDQVIKAFAERQKQKIIEGPIR